MFKSPEAADWVKLITFHCQQCNTVLADSFGVCGEVKCINSIACIKVTKGVVVGDSALPVNKGQLANCICSNLKCSSCNCVLGKVIHSAPSCLASVRSMFLLDKANLSCYRLGSSSMVKASALTLDLNPLKETINEMRQEFEDQLDHISELKNRLEGQSFTSQETLKNNKRH